MNKILVKIIVVAITGSIIGAVGFYFWKSNNVSQADTTALADNVKKEDGSKALISQAEKEAEDEKNKKNETQAISYIGKNINKITGLRIEFAQKLTPTRIWFISSMDFYVDYKDSNLNLRRILVRRLSEGDQAAYEVLGYFTPGDNGWTLESGRDIEGAVPIRSYEKNEETGEWAVR